MGFLGEFVGGNHSDVAVMTIRDGDAGGVNDVDVYGDDVPVPTTLHQHFSR